MRTAVLLLACLLVVPLAAASDQIALPVYNETLHIQNGACVPLNATVDIASLGWGVPRLLYFHPWTDDLSVSGNDFPTYSLDMPNTVRKLSNFYIDPAIFGNRTGYWYQNYRMNETEPSANQRMFYVNWTCPAKGNVSEVVTTVSRTVKTTPDALPYLPEQRPADILIARGDTVSFSWDVPARWWLFGYSTGSYQYDRHAENGSIILDPRAMKDLQPGNYHLDIIRPGKNEIFEESYNKQSIESPFAAKPSVYIGDLDPQSVEAKLKTFVAATLDDNLASLRVSYEEPAIEIKRVDAILSGDNKTWYNIRGYTNVADGTLLTVTIDPGTLNAETRGIRQWNAKIIGRKTDLGVSRQFNIMIPIDYGQIFPGPHEFALTTPTGAKQRVPFYIYKELAPHNIPPQYIEYTGASPHITPQIITNTVIREVTVERTVYVNVTPAPEEIQRAQDRAAWTVAFTAGGCIAAILVAILTGLWLISVYRRARETHA